MCVCVGSVVVGERWFARLRTGKPSTRECWMCGCLCRIIKGRLLDHSVQVGAPFFVTRILERVRPAWDMVFLDRFAARGFGSLLVQKWAANFMGSYAAVCLRPTDLGVF